MIAKFYFKNNEIRQHILNKISYNVNPGFERNGKIRFNGNEIDFIGRSRIDGELMFSADDAIMQKIINELTFKGFLINCEIIQEVKRIYSDMDPYGEEDWGDFD